MVEFGEGNCFSLNNKIELRAHPLMPGFGLFAKSKIEKGEIVWSDKTEYPLTDIETMNTWSKEKYEEFVHFAYQVSETQFLGFLSLLTSSQDHFTKKEN
jgi:hypothetical protein